MSVLVELVPMTPHRVVAPASERNRRAKVRGETHAWRAKSPTVSGCSRRSRAQSSVGPRRDAPDDRSHWIGVLRAQELLEAGNASIEEVAGVCGFADTAALRYHAARSAPRQPPIGSPSGSTARPGVSRGAPCPDRPHKAGTRTKRRRARWRAGGRREARSAAPDPEEIGSQRATVRLGSPISRATAKASPCNSHLNWKKQRMTTPIDHAPAGTSTAWPLRPDARSVELIEISPVEEHDRTMATIARNMGLVAS
jgi:AraC-like DNA-binding protein